ncbi:hypothetical protein ABC977_10665 [Thioalkalicoccus limnaeus]|uniref:Uncharacterized protein n=1 Tax=Thioalkalicoccus limnaeus TaxID=120681 RepID=A0ABV4BFA4_9GAMM
MNKKSTTSSASANRLERLRKQLGKQAKRLVEALRLLSATDRRHKARRARLKALLADMKDQEKTIRERLGEIPDETERTQLERRLQILRQQRKKAVTMFKERQDSDR